MARKPSTLYVTRGTVQVELTAKGEAIIIINPTQGFSVKAGKEDYIVFVSEDALTDKGFEAQVFKKTQAFQTKSKDFIPILTQAAFDRTNIEIKMKKPPLSPPDDPLEIEIESVTIPATP